MNELLKDLNYPEALAALRQVAEEAAKTKGKSLEDLEEEFKKEVEEQGVEIPAAEAVFDWEDHGEHLTLLLGSLLDSEDDFTRKAAQTAVLEVKDKGQVQEFATALTVGAVIFAIGLLSKVNYSKEEGFSLEPGFPDLEKIPELVKAFLTGMPE